MIVFFGRPSDDPLRLAVDAARAAGVEHLVLDQDHLESCDLVRTVPGPEGMVRAGGRTVDLDDVTAVYARPLDHTTGAVGAAARARAGCFHELFVAWLDVTAAFVVSRPQAMTSNSSKPYQAQLIARAGFAVPDTLVTSDPDEARSFRDRHRRVVYKSISGVRSIVRELTAGDDARLHRLRGLPVQFQAHVPGTDVRAHVIGSEVFAARVDSAAVDYRYATRDGLTADLEAFELPADVAARCVTLAASLGLPFTGVDLRRTPDGEWVCFEANPMPGYSYYETGAGLPISAALVRLLAGAGVAGRR